MLMGDRNGTAPIVSDQCQDRVACEYTAAPCGISSKWFGDNNNIAGADSWDDIPEDIDIAHKICETECDFQLLVMEDDWDDFSETYDLMKKLE